MAVRGQAAADISSGTNPISGSIITATTKFLAPDGTNAAPGYAFTNETGTGIYRPASAQLAFALNTNIGFFLSGANTTAQLPSTGLYGWSSTGNASQAGDLFLVRDAANTLAQKNGANDQLFRKYGGNSGLEEWGSISENLTLSTGGTTTDTAANLLPANSYIEAVTARITTTIATATNWAVGDPTTSARFSAANGTLTSGTTSVGITQVDQTGAAGPKQTAAAKVRITTTGTPSAGAIRLTSYYRSYTPATS